MFAPQGIRFVLAGFGLLYAAASMPAAGPEKWNVVSIVTDDQGAWALGCYGNKECRTPNMDRLAREGARFLNAFTPTPVCSPSRASMLCSLYGTQVGITDWIAPQEADAGMGLAPDVLTWPKILHQQGYRTALIGKWHLGTQPRFHPTKNGFDHFFGFLGGGNQPMDPVLEKTVKPARSKVRCLTSSPTTPCNLLRRINRSRSRCSCTSALRTCLTVLSCLSIPHRSAISIRPFRLFAVSTPSRSKTGRATITPAFIPLIATSVGCSPSSTIWT